MWVAADYESTALFTLKPATATSSGGRTLPVPTPFAVKMALLDVACRVLGVKAAQTDWPWLNACRVALRPAARLVVNNTFIKVLRPRRNPAEPGTPDAGFFQRTITYREYAYLDGAFGLALEVGDEAQAVRLGEWLTCLNYLGKRGGFIQLLGIPLLLDSLDNRYVVVGEALTGFDMNSLLMQLDDTTERMTFDRANIYSGKNITLGKERVLHHVALPYRLVQSSRGYSFYELAEGEAGADGTAI
jgi:hypothetical protein